MFMSNICILPTYICNALTVPLHKNNWTGSHCIINLTLSLRLITHEVKNLKLILFPLYKWSLRQATFLCGSLCHSGHHWSERYFGRKKTMIHSMSHSEEKAWAWQIRKRLRGERGFLYFKHTFVHKRKNGQSDTKFRPTRVSAKNDLFIAIP